MAVALNDAQARCTSYAESSKKVLAYADNDLDVLLIGKTGSGKSRTGNTILGHEVFEYASSCEPVTQSVSTGVVKFGARVIKVVDGPGLGDTSKMKDVEKATMMVIDSMKYAVTLSPQGYHAFLLVVKYGGRLTNEDFEYIRLLKTIFGEHFVKRFCILVVTHGDTFGKDKNNKGKAFKEWCMEQKGVFKYLLTECNNRVILFDNHSTNGNVKSAQVSTLVNMIDNLQSTEISRKIILVSVKEPMIRDYILNNLNLIWHDYRKSKDYDEPAIQITKALECAKEMEKLISKVITEDNETNVFSDHIAQIKRQHTMMEENIQSLKKITKYKSKLNEADRKHRQEKEKLKEVIQQLMQFQERKFLMELEAKEKEEAVRQKVAEEEMKLRESLQQARRQYESEMEIMQKKVKDIMKDEEQIEQLHKIEQLSM